MWEYTHECGTAHELLKSLTHGNKTIDSIVWSRSTVLWSDMVHTCTLELRKSDDFPVDCNAMSSTDALRMSSLWWCCSLTNCSYMNSLMNCYIFREVRPSNTQSKMPELTCLIATVQNSSELHQEAERTRRHQTVHGTHEVIVVWQTSRLFIWGWRGVFCSDHTTFI